MMINSRFRRHALVAVIVVLFLQLRLLAEDGHSGWLRYAPLPSTAVARYGTLPAHVVRLGDSVVLRSAERELSEGLHGMLGHPLTSSDQVHQPSIVCGSVGALRSSLPELALPDLAADSYFLRTVQIRGFPSIVIAGGTDRGVLYGVFDLLRKIGTQQDITNLNEIRQPYASLRWVNQWDNLNGTIERGYAGPSIFFENGGVRSDLTRAGEYARLLASVGINGCAVNNVNADPRMLQPSFLPQLARIADTFRPWGVQLAISVDLGSPKTVGGLDSFDPLNPAVVDWWKTTVDAIYALIPDFGGFVVKADSEGRVGPSSYGRNPADAANALARALKPHGGYLFYRAFVYNHHLDWRDPKADRARAAYDIFHPLEGKFDDNVIVQIKNGPIDFQVREPASPLFAGLEKTNEAIELQITQEYMGQQKHAVFLVPMWKEVVGFDLHAQDRSTPVKDLVSGKSFRRPVGGFAGVANVGMEPNWLHHPLAMANLYGFGRLAWDPNLSAGAIADEWTKLTFNDDPLADRTIDLILLTSWHTYEDYTGPLGLGTLTNIVGAHYGPGIESAERNGWGQWIRADHEGIGMDRSMASGTGYIGQYPPAVAQMFESLQTTPDNLLLFFHHVPYTYALHSGKTVIQHVYDSHYQGAERVAEYVQQWKLLRGHIDDERYDRVLQLLTYQAGHAIVWRDAVCNWFQHMSGIPDAKGRVGHYPDRIEAESMHLDGYVPLDVHPWETASGGKAVVCKREQACTASFRFRGPAGRYDFSVEYFDQNNGASRYRVFVDGRQVGEWVADAHLPATEPNGDSSTRHTIPSVALQPRQEIRIEGTPNGEERAPVDYVELHPARE